MQRALLLRANRLRVVTQSLPKQSATTVLRQLSISKPSIKISRNTTCLNVANSNIITKRAFSEQQVPDVENASQTTKSLEAVELNISNFQQAVMKSPIPVIINCYADWAESCAEVTNKISSLVKETEGRVRLANLNVDKNQDLAQAFQITNVPTVLSFYDGKFVDGFGGPKSETEMRDFIGELLKKGGARDVTVMLDDADAKLKEGDTQGASEIYKDLLNQPQLKGEVYALAGLVRVALAENQPDIAKELIEHIKNNFPKDMSHPQVKKALTAAEFLSTSGGQNLRDLESKVQSDPSDSESKFQLASAYVANGNHQKALDLCFQMLRRDKHDEEAKKLTFKIFDSLGPKDPIVREARKRLANVLFV